MKVAIRIGIIVLAVALVAGLCALFLPKLLKSRSASEANEDAAAVSEKSGETNVQALMNYAQRLADAGNPEAAGAVLEKLPAAAKVDADHHAVQTLSQDAQIDMLRRLARTDTQDILTGKNTTHSFTDVTETDWFYDAAQWAARKGIVSGESFSPSNPATRAQVITFLWRAKGEPEPALSQCPFTDVAADAYYYKPVVWAFEKGIVDISGDGKFHAEDTVTRAQTVAFLYRAEGEPAVRESAPFSDVSDNDWFASAAAWAYAQGVVSLNDAKTFNPQGKCTRAQYINFLYCCYG